MKNKDCTLSTGKSSIEIVKTNKKIENSNTDHIYFKFQIKFENSNTDQKYNAIFNWNVKNYNNDKSSVTT